MPSTYYSLNFHIVFSTKNRELFIQKEWSDRMHQFLGGTVKGLGGIPTQIGGVADHVHLLVGLKPTHCLSDFMRDLKKSSSGWVHDEIKIKSFKWQEGYSAFSVSPTSCESVRQYIISQEEHHRKKTFREELEELLPLAGVEFNQEYLD